MNPLVRIVAKRRKIVAGLMSGTSIDGLDAALISVTGKGTSTRVRTLAYTSIPHSDEFRRMILKNSDPATADLDEIARLNILFGMMSADAVRKLAGISGLRLSDIDLIGSHGQTIRHLPATARLSGRNVRATFQIGHPSVIAAQTGIVTVGDFRVADIAAGGSGAPLVPAVDYLLLRSGTRCRAALNIGGIANITIIPRRADPGSVRAFDTGPGNMLIDGLTAELFGQPCDWDGAIASTGRINSRLLSRLIRHPYLRIKPPKSTGREQFGAAYAGKILGMSRSIPPEDIITTVTEFTALNIFDSYLRFVRKRTRVQDLVVSGGGIHNRYLMGALGRYFSDAAVMTSSAFGLDPDAKEAVCFAVLANETISGMPGNITGATGARRRAVLGVIALP